MAASVSLPLESHAHGLSSQQEDLLRLIGFLQLEHGSPEKAVTVFDALLAMRPDDMQLRFSLTLSLLRIGDGAGALQVIEDTAYLHSAQAPQEPVPLFHLLRSQALVQLGRLPEAARSMRIFIRQRRSEQATKE